MATVGDWSNATLAVEADVTSRYSRASSLLASGETISDFITKAKEEIGDALDVDLRQYRGEISITDVADLKDLIANPTVFKAAAVAYALKLLFEKNIFEAEDFHDRQMRIYTQEYREMYQRGLNLMQFDKDAGGAIEDEEYADGIPANRFRRV